MAKKYYWLKLKKDFMQGDVVDYLMSQSNGANYVVLYQMLCFMTLNTNGVMATAINEVILPYNIEKIQRDCKYFNEDTIVVALDLFKKLGLVYKNLDGMYQLNEYEELVGSETDKAKMMRNLRGKKELDGNNVTKQLPNCYTEIEKDLDLDLDKDLDSNKNLDSFYKTIYEYYLSLELIKHNKLTVARKNAIKRAINQNGYTLEDCKTLLDRHKEVVELTKGLEMKVEPRTIEQFFGQKVFNGTHLICSEYEIGGAKYQRYLNESSKVIKKGRYEEIDIFSDD